MLKKISNFILLMCLMASALIANDDNRLTYKIIFNYNDGHVYKYIYNEKTEIKREFADKSKLEFSRDSKMYFHLKNYESSKGGFETVTVVMDSLRHDLDSAKKRQWKFFSRDENFMNHWNQDVAIYNMNSGLDYKYVISPYFEIADILPGENMKQVIMQIDSFRTDMRPEKFLMFRNALSKAGINQISDVKKINYPVRRVVKDSVWRSGIELVIGGVQFNDSVDVKFLGEKGGFYKMEAEFKLSQFIKNQIVLYGTKTNITEPLSADLTCKMTFEVSALGRVEATILTAEGTITYIDQENKQFTDKIKTKMSWTADGRYEY